MYAIFSTFAYLVNLLLASRFLPVSPKLSLTLSALPLRAEPRSSFAESLQNRKSMKQ